MDVGEFWQENKRWILGVLLGVVVFFVAHKVISATWSTPRGGGGGGGDYYMSSARDAAEQDAVALDAELARVRKAAAFEPDGDYTLAGKGLADTHFSAVDDALRKKLTRRANVLDVQLSGKDIAWTPPLGREEIADTLVSLAVVDTLTTALMEAHETVRGADPAARGLTAIDDLKVPPRRRARRTIRRGREQDVRIEDFVNNYPVQVTFRADAQVLRLFLEAVRNGVSYGPLTMSAFTATGGKRPGEPITVKATFAAVVLKDEEVAES